MCGIHACISIVPGGCTPVNDPPLSDVLHRQLCNRGPDHFGTVVSEYTPAADCTLPRARLSLTSSVLSLRGDGVTRQPFVDDGEADDGAGSTLCWNGEAWRLGGEDLSGNDGFAVFRELSKASGDDAAGRRNSVLSVLRTIQGPFAFIFFDRPGGCVYFGRDRLGRRSLLMRRGGYDSSHAGTETYCDVLALSSVADCADDQWTEVAADGIYTMDLTHLLHRPSGPVIDRPPADTIVRYSWTAEMAGTTDDASVVLGISRFNMTTDAPDDQDVLSVDSPAVQQLRRQLAASLRLRVLNIPRLPFLGSQRDTLDTRIAVLFSGGLDCTVLARMTHDLLPSEQGVDLINVAFENPRVVSHFHGETNAYEACPDRITGRKSYAELQRVCPHRTWRFIAVNVPYAETLSHRREIVFLMYPHNTEMDLSIASALYFAARGVGICSGGDGVCTSNPLPVSTPARVLLSGLGADELFGGYGRHGIAFTRSGYAGLVDELLLDVSRLGKRNLGRDDRATARWGKEVRFPFLDETFVAWAVGLPVWEKCDFANAELQAGDAAFDPAKRVLRLVAQSLGMTDVAQEKKRAIQFGARTAKMESGRTKGTAVIS